MAKMIKLLSAAAAVAMFAGSAQAADVEVAPESPSWTGGYIGVVGGYGWGDSDSSADVVDSADNTTVLATDVDGSIDVEGFLIGAQLGYDFDMGNGLVLGVAGDWSWTGMDGKSCIDNDTCVPAEADDSYASADVNWLATVRARAGFTTGSMLIYGTGGLAIADADSSVTFIDGAADPARGDSNTHFGWVIGAGAEFKVTENMSLGAEYLHVDLGSEDYTFRGSGLAGDTDILSNADLQIDIVRASLNLRF
jgi:outer membrane immunogenic protein